MSAEPVCEMISADCLVGRVRALKQGGWRLVQISATRLPEAVELTYSFDLDRQLTNLRLLTLSGGPGIPSISGVYWCALMYENEIHDLFGVVIEGMAVDFKGNFYRTAIKHPFASTKPPPAPKAAAPKPAGPAPAPVAA
jgi:ech hydrogenase subunit D